MAEELLDGADVVAVGEEPPAGPSVACLRVPEAATAPGVTGGGAASGGVPRRSQSAAEGAPRAAPVEPPGEALLHLRPENHPGEFARGG